MHPSQRCAFSSDWITNTATISNTVAVDDGTEGCKSTARLLLVDLAAAHEISSRALIRRKLIDGTIVGISSIRIVAVDGEECKKEGGGRVEASVW